MIFYGNETNVTLMAHKFDFLKKKTLFGLFNNQVESLSFI